MTNRIKTWLFKNRRVAGLTMSVGKEETRFHLIVLERQGSEIQVLQQLSDLDSIDQVIEALPKNTPVQFCLNGRGILHKKLAPASDQQLIQAVLPNADPTQFYLQKTDAAAGLIVSIIRQQMLDDSIEQFINKGVWITGLSLGVFDSQVLWPYLEKPVTLNTNQYQLEFDREGKITTFRPEASIVGHTFKIGDDAISAILLPSYGKALKAILGHSDNWTTEQVGTLKDEYQQKQLFDKAWRVALGVVGIILLSNTFFYFHYKDKNAQLRGASAFALAQISELDILKTKIEKHQQLVQMTSVNQSTDLSFYADELGKSLSKGLKFLDLNIFPRTGKDSDYNQKTLVKYQRNHIRIKGQCDNSLTYNNWIKKLDSLDWIKSVQHLDYKDLSKQLSEFELNIIIDSE